MTEAMRIAFDRYAYPDAAGSGVIQRGDDDRIADAEEFGVDARTR